jgi:hypothetical protein
MKRILISYDLMRPGQNYEELWKYLRGFPKAIRPLYSLWLVRSEKTPKKIRDEIINRGLIDKNDKIVVIDTTDVASAWNPASLPWIRNTASENTLLKNSYLLEALRRRANNF